MTAMNLLAVESAFEPCSVALWRDGSLWERFEAGPRNHARQLLPFVQELLAEADTSLSDLDAIAFSRGPGSFTSLRIGIGVVQGLAWGAGLPVVPVSSLQATAQVALQHGVERAWVAMDARMGEVYTACFEQQDGRMGPVTAERVCPPDEAWPERPGDWTGVGNGFERFEALAESGVAHRRVDDWPTARAVAELAAAFLERSPGLPPERAQPVYLRDKVAEKPG